jgi:hypothetical protein
VRVVGSVTRKSGSAWNNTHDSSKPEWSEDALTFRIGATGVTVKWIVKAGLGVPLSYLTLVQWTASLEGEDRLQEDTAAGGARGIDLSSQRV